MGLFLLVLYAALPTNAQGKSPAGKRESQYYCECGCMYEKDEKLTGAWLV